LLCLGSVAGSVAFGEKGWKVKKKEVLSRLWEKVMKFY